MDTDTTRQNIDRRELPAPHDYYAPPGPYPDGEGPSDYTECFRCGAGFSEASDEAGCPRVPEFDN